MRTRGWRTASGPGPDDPRAAVLHTVVSALVVAVLTAAAALAWATGTAREHARDHAETSAQAVVESIVAPLVTPELLAGDAAAYGRLDEAVSVRLRDGSISRVKLWDGTGRVLYSDEARLVGERFPGDQASVVATVSEVSTLLADENMYERMFPQLVEVYVPMGTVAGQEVVFEAYFPASRLGAQQLTGAVVIAVGGLGASLLLLALQVPQTFRLATRLQREEREQALLSERLATARVEERQRIAASLRSGVVQDLAGVGLLLDSLERDLREPSVRDLVTRARTILREDMSRLRLLPEIDAAADTGSATSSGSGGLR